MDSISSAFMFSLFLTLSLCGQYLLCNIELGGCAKMKVKSQLHFVWVVRIFQEIEAKQVWLHLVKPWEGGRGAGFWQFGTFKQDFDNRQSLLCD